MGGGGRLIGFEVGCPPGELGNRFGQLAAVAAGEVLLVGVVLLEDRQPLQFGVGFGERQHGRVARRDGFDFGIGEFLAADVLGPP